MGDKEKKLVEAITPMDEDFTQWYTDVVIKAGLVSYSNIKGFIILKPAGYALWENIQKHLDARFKATGVENVYLPLLIPESLLQKEKDHVEGFAPEVAWVTSGGTEPLTERYCVRPTSETLFCDFYKGEIHSYKDLPMVYNQWCSVVRWEKETRPFLRSREFLWQEGHTMHATREEAEERTQQMLEVYAAFLEEDMAIPVIRGRKTDKEKFAGAEATYTVEAMMHDGRALQSATSHHFGDGFARAYDITFTGKDNAPHHPFQTSWGLSTRVIGAMIMVHGDDSGLICPPRIAPLQMTIIPIQQKKEGVTEAATALCDALKAAGIRARADLTDKSPGFKFSEQEMRGIPLRAEIGPRDLEAGNCVLVRRDTGEKVTCAIADAPATAERLLEEIQANLLRRAKEHLESCIATAHNWEEFKENFRETKGFVKAMWCGDRACEDKIKEELSVTSRCMPFTQEHFAETCVCCGKPAKKMVVWGRSY